MDDQSHSHHSQQQAVTHEPLSAELKKRIAKNIRSFDLYALVDLLRHLGFDYSSIKVEGHLGLESQPSVLKSIHFDPNNQAVTIGLYMGLASANGYLPSYFFNMVDEGVIDESHFQDLIGFFDQHLLKTWLGSLMPQIAYIRASRFNWIKTMASFTSLSHLQHLFSMVFPELQVRCERYEINHSVASKPCVLGTSKIGLEMILGDYFSILGYCHRITLISDNENNLHNEPWHVCAKARLHQFIYPLIQSLDLFVEIVLVVRDSNRWLSLQEDSITLGFERFKGQEDQFKKITLHYGPIPT